MIVRVRGIEQTVEDARFEERSVEPNKGMKSFIGAKESGCCRKA
jgi:hypothetical protein